ncbi:MAG: holo-ACP synthase [Deltaproteobacteria bacterium]|nr:holo-ACP synthase [Deltaproteobacteria bacterium]MBN2845671.1 holo-ACP synthase [Deltaproteobacteria bacterium]
MRNSIHGIGTDLVEVARIERIIKKWNGHFLKRVFSENEIVYCERKAHSPQHYAARFAVKEALLKSLGKGLFSGLSLRDIEVVNTKEGRPQLMVHGKVRGIIDALNIITCHVSISHTNNFATAVVILEKSATL